MYRFIGLDLLLAAFLLFAVNTAVAGQEDKQASTLENVDRLVELLYSLEDFQVRFVNALDNDVVFIDFSDDAYFLKTLTENARTTALKEYGESIGRAALNLTQPEVDSLITALQSPYGEVIRKMFTLDNSEVERELARYVNRIVDEGLATLQVRDSLLFEKEYPFDLKEIMSGTYDNFTGHGQLVKVERTQSSQKETVNELAFNLKVSWLNNSKYSLTTLPGNPLSPATEVVANIYEIDGKSYKYIWQYPDGSYEKHELLRTGFESYADEVKAFRWSLYDKYADGFTSPLKTEEIERFKSGGGHKFYKVADDFRVEARVELEGDDSKTITMMTSNEQEREYRVYGKAHFTMDGKQLALDLYEPIQQNDSNEERRLFLPFRDLTSGESSYGGGRYIDLDIPAGDKIVIDFNKSYNPYCAYTDGYSCPIPPEGNTLNVAIEAGIMAPELK